MGNKKSCFAIVFLISLTIAFSEEISEPKNYYIRANDDGNEEIVQRLSWQPVKDILRYEVQIEKKLSDDAAAKNQKSKKQSENEITEDGFEILPVVKTEESFVEITLSSGSYRYNLTVYNLLDKPEIISDWYYFDVIKAYQPEVNSISPSTVYLDEQNDGVFYASGKNLLEESMYSLQKMNRDKDSYTADIKEHDDGNKKVSLQFDIKKLDVGTYDLAVMNPGGLSAGAGPVKIKYKKVTDFDVSLGYACPMILYDRTLPDYMGKNLWPVSAAARASFMFSKHRYGYFGLGVSAFAARMDAEYDTYSIEGNFLCANANFVYQLPLFKRRFVLELHGGAGAAYFCNYAFHFQNNINSEPLNSVVLSADAALAAQIYFTKRLYADICAEYIMAFVPDMQLGMFVPSVSIGWQF
ncbi:hypothetical protein [Treponema brennaborense]|uniref:Uncharacterized protein n=1 Tax=Treponema brennaborense (strain DSM 12168 / CIP 105900 / DD5/3) TaxID=906968 RepID=F4LK96_TREBD|nr:hypothetical protein [Treponema brennaborense]AEE15485.1 hypothetical protein Trebr_0026 [Treponema brennaborense DSM 12168]